MNPAPHVIGRQHLRLRLAPGSPAPALAQQQAEEALRSPAVLAALDAVLSAACPPDEWLMVERLELPLGALPSAELEATLLRRLPELLRPRLAEAVAAARPASAGAWLAADAAGEASARSATAAAWSTAVAGAAPLMMPGLLGVASATRATAPATAWAVWLHFLRLGTLPVAWPAPASVEAWETQLLPLLAQATPAQREQLRRALAEAPVRQRLARQFSAALAAAVIGAVGSPAAAPHQAALATYLAPLLRPYGTYSAEAGEWLVQELLRRAATAAPTPWPAVLAALAPAGQPRVAASRLPDLVRAALAAADGQLAADNQLAANGASAAPATEEVPHGPDVAPEAAPAPSVAGLTGLTADTAAAPTWPAAAPAGAAPGHSGPAPAGAVAPAPTALAPGAPAPSGPAALPWPAGPAIPNAPAAPAAAPGLAGDAARAGGAEFVAHAGVVLLHPFVPACFAACGWLTAAGDAFRSPAARAEAVLLLHWLATGRASAPEYELRLPRLLCGVPDDEAPRRRQRLGRAARAEGQALLRAAIGHWTALRGTTPDGLRTGFLQREGKLERPAAGVPTLTVTQQAQDVLLERLPYGWGVSLARLPWLPQHLLINWA